MHKKTTTIVTELSSRIGSDKVITLPKVLIAHSHDASSHGAVIPDIVVFPKSTQDISAVLTFANLHAISVTAFGGGTSLEGNSIPVQKGISLDLSHMNQVLTIYKDDLQVVVEPGIIGSVLNDKLASHNLYFPAFPASSHIASVGGMVANNAGGMYAVKYGVVGDWVLALEVVLADGTVITCGSRSIKSVAGYDVKRLFIGSEGTLGIISKVTLRLIPQINNKLLLVLRFPSINQTLNATLEMLYATIDPAAVEFLDENSIRFINKQQHIGWKELPTVLVELHGVSVELNEKAELVNKIGLKNNAQPAVFAKTVGEQKNIWDIRSSVHSAIMASFADCGIVPGDIGVPISQIPKFISFVDAVTQKENIEYATFGHIGDGNFHVWLVYNKKVPESYVKAQKVAGKLVNKSLELNGTCTAEHGVGIGKRGFLQKEHASSIMYMQQVKKIFDPKGILNPGKIFL